MEFFVVYSHNEMLFSSEKKWTASLCNNVDGVSVMLSKNSQREGMT